MKKLIENSIKIIGIVTKNPKTTFNIEKEDEKKDYNYKSLTEISGRKLTVFFKYKEEEKEVQDKIQLQIIKSDNEDDIKTFILSSINNYLI